MAKILFLIVSLSIITTVVAVDYKEKKEILSNPYKQNPSASQTATVQIETFNVAVPFKTVKEFDGKLSTNTAKVVAEGQKGIACLIYTSLCLKGKEVNKRLIAVKVLEEPIDRVIKVGPRSLKLASRGNSRVLKMKATAYTPGHNCDTRTAIGLIARSGVVAVDPKVIPLGTYLYIKGYGKAIAGDTGSSIKGFRIDLCFVTLAEAKAFGRRIVEVKILD
ncbi:MAG: 3D domain-containing protein [Candidatus Subteraquimicrobiales bacterium]|nr:3D domain-containing protein [Candidatus Subteraquimicrobiales bacterium]